MENEILDDFFKKQKFDHTGFGVRLSAYLLDMI